jgi:hypothetical protein
MSNTNIYAMLEKQFFTQNCAAYEIEGMDAAFDGDADAAEGLSCFLRNDKRGLMAVAMWKSKVPREAFRAYFASAWDHDHQHVIQAARTTQRLAWMFRYAAFPVPDHLPDVVRVWRGTSGMGRPQAVRGHSWTVDRDVACWFAMRHADRYRLPLVLAADISRGDIALFHDERSEREAVLMKPPKAWIDGDATDWQAGFVRTETERRASDAAMPTEAGAEGAGMLTR